VREAIVRRPSLRRQSVNARLATADSLTRGEMDSLMAAIDKTKARKAEPPPKPPDSDEGEGEGEKGWRGLLKW
jgi:hypothetical protein